MSLSKLSAATRQAQANTTFSIDAFQPIVGKTSYAHADANAFTRVHFLAIAHSYSVNDGNKCKHQDEPCEPAIIWFVIAAEKGKKNSSAGRSPESSTSSTHSRSRNLVVGEMSSFYGQNLQALVHDNPIKTSVQAGAVLMPLAMFLLSLKSIRVLY